MCWTKYVFAWIENQINGARVQHSKADAKSQEGHLQGIIKDNSALEAYKEMLKHEAFWKNGNFFKIKGIINIIEQNQLCLMPWARNFR
ncbi:MAG: hypothetical protein SRB1_01489 [Desulfobacteraceae bacterium Eth-SRB1]|nr:MAG: hypothetical protein SRB1_01489 [Desulfobacteraceae bacterium Eth-SRB1]